MVGLASLWIPIVLSPVFVFVAVIHLALRHHWTDRARVPGEPDVLAARRTGTTRR